MKYVSTRGRECIEASLAIMRGISPDGGLYTPEEIPSVSKEDIEKIAGMCYPERAAEIISRFLADYTREELLEYAEAAYSEPKFPENTVPLVKTGSNTYIMELFHGPTCAFKDMALQILPHLLTSAMKKNGEKNKVCILVATSGDTGKAALEGFADVKDTSIFVFYPRDGVSDIQKRQMITQRGSNVGVCSVTGNFDDAQTGVKKIFADSDFNNKLAANDIRLSSANSINWGRLVPQVVYYISAYADLVKTGEISNGEKINVCVPTGNFGNILAAFIAREMGLPVNKLICASNRNNVLTDFIKDGIYDRNREFYLTSSPSMDILISSNVERLLWLITGMNPEITAGYMKDLSATGKYELSESEKKKMNSVFESGWASEKDTLDTIKKYYDKYGYLADTHTAVALSVNDKYSAENADDIKTIVAATASPYKFADSVLLALDGKERENSLGLVRELSDMTSTEIPAPLKDLEAREIRFGGCTDTSGMKKEVAESLGIDLYR